MNNNSPITGKPMLRQSEPCTLKFRKEPFNIVFHYWLCEDTGERYEDEAMADLNLNQVYDQYRAKYDIPSAEKIAEVRRKYGVSALKMSKILGFGDNQYREYENGSMPSVSNGRLIMQAAEVRNFLAMVRSSEGTIGQKDAHNIISAFQLKAV